jgi:hypothetical protein
VLLCRCGIDEAFVVAISRSLPQLKLLDLSNNTKLDVSTVLSCSGSNVSSRSRLLQLQALNVGGMKLMRPDVLGGLTMLTSLSLVDVTVAEPRSLLAALPQLLQLQDLDMRGWEGRTFTVAALQNALMPLTQLTALSLSNTAYFDDPAALGQQLAAQQSSGDGRQPTVGGLFPALYLPRLQVLDANKLHWSGREKARAQKPLCGTGDLQDIITAMPVISCLRVKGSMGNTLGSQTDLESFSALAGSLTSLEMSAEQGLRDEHLESLTRLSGLSSLVVAKVGSHITDRGILRLSTLSALSHLELTGVLSNGVSMELLPGRGTEAGTEFKLQNKLDKVGGLRCCSFSCANSIIVTLHCVALGLCTCCTGSLICTSVALALLFYKGWCLGCMPLRVLSTIIVHVLTVAHMCAPLCASLLYASHTLRAIPCLQQFGCLEATVAQQLKHLSDRQGSAQMRQMHLTLQAAKEGEARCAVLLCAAFGQYSCSNHVASRIIRSMPRPLCCGRCHGSRTYIRRIFMPHKCQSHRRCHVHCCCGGHTF